MSSTPVSAIRKVVASSLIGATIEWYDFFLYGVMASLIFNHQYFPSADPMVSTMLAYATFAVGFISRPLGGIIFGHFGDRVGRKNMLVFTLVLMGVATFAIALIPTYQSIGIWAPILLLTCRIVQGLGLGGEWGGAVLMTYEHAPENKRGFYASLPQMGLAIGLCSAASIVAVLSGVLSNDAFAAWGWRIGFLVSAGLVFVGLYIRLTVSETPEFANIKAQNSASRIPFVEMAKKYPGNIAKGMGVRYIDGVFFNIFAVFIIGYLVNHLHLDRTDALTGVIVASVVMCFFIPYFGALSDRVGRTQTYFWGSLITGISALPAFWLMAHFSSHMLVVWLSIIIPFGIFYASIYGPEAALFCELFDTRVRYTGISFVYQFSGIFASGITPMIAAALLVAGNGTPWLVVAYTIFAGLVSALCALLIGRSRRDQSQEHTRVTISRPPELSQER